MTGAEADADRTYHRSGRPNPGRGAGPYCGRDADRGDGRP